MAILKLTFYWSSNIHLKVHKNTIRRSLVLTVLLSVLYFIFLAYGLSGKKETFGKLLIYYMYGPIYITDKISPMGHSINVFILIPLFLLQHFLIAFGLMSVWGFRAAKNNRKLIDQLGNKIDKNDPEAFFQLGLRCQFRRGIGIDEERAVHWYLMAAKQGHPNSMNNLGLMYQFGKGVPGNQSEAVNWFRKAIEKGSGEAYSNLAYMYENGLGVQEDPEKAIKCYQKAIERGITQAMYNLGMLYWTGTGVTKDLEEAYKWIFLFDLKRKHAPDNQEEIEIRDNLQIFENNMTKEQIGSAKEKARQWQVEHPKTQ